MGLPFTSIPSSIVFFSRCNYVNNVALSDGEGKASFDSMNC